MIIMSAVVLIMQKFRIMHKFRLRTDAKNLHNANMETVHGGWFYLMHSDYSTAWPGPIGLQGNRTQTKQCPETAR